MCCSQWKPTCDISYRYSRSWTYLYVERFLEDFFEFLVLNVIPFDLDHTTAAVPYHVHLSQLGAAYVVAFFFHLHQIMQAEEKNVFSSMFIAKNWWLHRTLFTNISTLNSKAIQSTRKKVYFRYTLANILMLHIKVHESLEHVLVSRRHIILPRKYLAQELTSRNTAWTHTLNEKTFKQRQHPYKLWNKSSFNWVSSSSSNISVWYSRVYTISFDNYSLWANTEEHYCVLGTKWGA